jgi:hypothetical protein
MTEGMTQIDNLRAAGFSDEEVGQWEADERAKLSGAGFNEEEIGSYFGKKTFNDQPVKDYFEKSIGDAAQAAKGDGTTEPKPFTFGDAFEAGWQNSVTGLMDRGKAPDVTLPDDSAWYQRLAFNTATIAGDVPAMVGGFVIGGGAGAGTGPGAAITGAAGAFAMPAALRATMMDAYTKGEFKTPGEFVERAGGIMVDTGKAWITGAATGGAGVGARAVLPQATTTMGSVFRSTAVTTAEVATMATASRAMEGELPHAQDFLDAALVVGAFHGVAKTTKAVSQKFRDVYSQTNKKPLEVLNDMQNDPTVKQDMLADNVPVPSVYKDMVDPYFKQPEPTPKAAEPVKPEPGTFEAAQANILEKVSIGGSDKGPKPTFTDLYTTIVDDLHPIKKAVEKMTAGEKPAVIDDPYVLARLTRGAAGRADQFLTQAPFDYKTLQNNGKSLKEIMDPFKDNVDGFRAYVVAKRAQELEGRGIQSGFKKEDIDTVVKGGKQYEKASAELVEFQNNVTKYLRDSGVISEESYAAMMTANKNYVPFYRAMDHLAGGPTAAKGLQATDPIKAIKGSDKGIIDPIESIIKNTYMYTAIADRNAAGQAFVRMAQKDMPEMAKKIDANIVGSKVSETEMAAYLKENGIDKVPEELLTIFRARTAPLAENQIAVFENGKRSVYELPEAVAAAFKSADKETVGWLFQLMAAPTRLFRAGTTLSPDFMPRNLVRDQLDAFLNSKNHFVPVLTTIRGAASMVAKDADFQNWMKSGGANAALISMDRQYLQNRIFKLNEQTGDWLSKTWNVAKSPVEVLRIVSELAENATRVGEYRNAYRSNLSKGADQKSAMLDAGFQSREVTLDFSRTGAKTRSLNMIIAFWNAQVQGIDRIGRRFAEAPLETSAKVAGSIMLPSILLWYANHDDPRYKDIPNWQKDMFWIVMTDDHIYRIPKPHETGVIFGSGMERFLDYVSGTNPDSLGPFMKNLASAFAPGVVPTVAAPVIEQFANKSLFSGAPIIPADAEGLLPEYQYQAYTSELTKALGRIVGSIPGMKESQFASPALIDNYVRQWSGGLGVYAVQIADAGLRKTGVLPDPIQPASTLADIPVIKAFIVRNPSAGAQPIQDFFENYESRKRVVDTVRNLARNGDPVAAQKEVQLNPQAMVKMDGVHRALVNQQKFVKLIWKNPNISAEEKRQLIDATYARMLIIAKSGNETIKQIDAGMSQ